MKENKENIVLIMSGGSGIRFGAKVPKQYCYMNGKAVIEYAIDACRLSSMTDEIVIVTAEEYLIKVKEQYGFPTTKGGENRTHSLANGLKYVYDHYNCKKIIIANAVCPLMTSEQIDKYFQLLDNYDYVLTTWKIVSTLGKYDGSLIDRDDYFHVMEPEAYQFETLYRNYKRDYPVPYIFHQMPRDSKGYYCFDYPYTMKITYASDIKVAYVLYQEYIQKPVEEKTKQKMREWISSFEKTDVTQWQIQIPIYMEELANRWQLTDWKMNPNAFSTCVFEAKSSLYGSVIVKLHAPEGRYDLELAFYKLYQGKDMPALLDYDNDYRAMLIQRVLPGIQVKFDVNSKVFRDFFDEYQKNMIHINNNNLNGLMIPSIMDEFYINEKQAAKYTYEKAFRNKMEEKAKELWGKYFSTAPIYFLHRDIHKRNILRGDNGKLWLIDPLGIKGPKEFEYIISIFIEVRAKPERCKEIFNEMLTFFSKYCESNSLYIAAFILWVHKMNEYVFSQKDKFVRARTTIETMKRLFFDEKEEFISNWRNG